MSLAGKNAIVTGGASGIGLAACRRLARDGAGIAVWDIDEAGARSAPRPCWSLRPEGRAVTHVRVDVSNRAQVNAGLQRVHDELGTVQILVNNAGVTSFKPFLEVTEEEWGPGSCQRQPQEPALLHPGCATGDARRRLGTCDQHLLFQRPDGLPAAHDHVRFLQGWGDRLHQIPGG